MDPLCIFHGHDLVRCVLDRSTVYVWQLCLVAVSKYICQLGKGFFDTGLMVVAPRHTLPLAPH